MWTLCGCLVAFCDTAKYSRRLNLYGRLVAYNSSIFASNKKKQQVMSRRVKIEDGVWCCFDNFRNNALNRLDNSVENASSENQGKEVHR